jgi:phage-related protein
MADIFVGSVSVGVVPDARGWQEKLRAELVPSSSSVGEEVGSTVGRRITENLGKSGEESGSAFSKTFKERVEAAMKSLPDIELDGNSTPVEEKIYKIKLLLEELSKQDLIDADTAMAELEVIDKELEKISHDAKGIDVRFDTARAHEELAALQTQMKAMDEESKGFRFSGGAMPGMGMGIAGGIAGALPLLGVLGPIGGVGAAAAAGIGLAIPTFMQLHNTMSQIATDQKAYDNALTQTAKNTAAAKLVHDWQQLDPAQAKAVMSLKSFEDQFKQMTSVLAPQVYGLISQVLDGIKGILPTIIPLAQAGLRAISAMIDPLIAFFHSGIFQGFIQEAIRIAVPAAQAIAHLLIAILGPIIKMLTELMPMGLRILQSVGPFVENVLSGIGDAIVTIVNTAGPAFAELLQALGPALRAIFVALGPALGQLAKAIAELLIPLAHIISALPPPVLQVLVDLILALVLGYKAWAAAQLLLNIVMDANPIGLIIIGIAALAAGIYILITRVHNWGQIWGSVVHAMHEAWSEFVNFFGRTVNLMHDYWGNLCNFLHRMWSDTVNFLHSVWSGFINFLSGSLSWLHSAWSNVCNFMHSAWSNTVNALHSIWSGFVNFLSGTLSFMHNGWSNLCNFMHGLWSNTVNFLHSAWSGFANFFSATGSAIARGWSIVCGAISSAWNNSIGFLIRMWQGFVNALMGAINTLTGAFDGFFGHISSGAHTAFGWIGSVGSFISHPFGLQHGGFIGGLIPGYGGGDIIPILAERGELILPKEAAGDPRAVSVAAAYGVPGYAAGGMVGRYQFGGIISAAEHIGSGLWGAVQGELQGPEGAAIKIAMSSILKSIIRVLPNLLEDAARALRGVDPSNIGFSRGGIVLDAGGYIPPGASTVYNFTGSQEYLVPGSPSGGRQGNTYHAHFDGLTGAAIESHVQSAFTAMSLRDGSLHRQGRRQ